MGCTTPALVEWRNPGLLCWIPRTWVSKLDVQKVTKAGIFIVKKMFPWFSWMSLMVKGKKKSKVVAVCAMRAYKGSTSIAPPISDSSILEEK
jgi:hypothetical protein